MSPWTGTSLVRSASIRARRKISAARRVATTAAAPSSPSSSLALGEDINDDDASFLPPSFDRAAGAAAPPAAAPGRIRERSDPSSSTRDCTSLLSADRRHVLHPYTSMTDPLPTFPVASASGIHIKLEDGRELIDGMSSWWAAVHGYRHPRIDAAVREQLEERMSHIMFGGLTHRTAVELCERLVDMVNENAGDINGIPGLAVSADRALKKVFLCDSGSVSVEVAMKMALQYWFTIGQPSKTKFVSLKNGYHGDTFGAMSVCDPLNGMHSMFRGVLATQRFVDSPTGPEEADAVETARQIESILSSVEGEEVAAVIMEPLVQGAGGMNFYHPSLLRKVRRSCDKHGVLLIFDEIATGFGRTGTMFAFQQNEETYRPWRSSSQSSRDPSSSSLPSVKDGKKNDDGATGRGDSAVSEMGGGFDEERGVAATHPSPVYPDILCLGKALTGGYMTLGATLTNDRISEGISGGTNGGVFMHGPTFMGNPLACAAAQASTDLLLDSPWRERVDATRSALIESLAPASDMDSVHEVRVLGAIGVCELREPLGDDMARVQRAFVDEEGVWLRPFGKLLYSMPPFNCPDLRKAHVEKIGRAICNVASKL